MARHLSRTRVATALVVSLSLAVGPLSLQASADAGTFGETRIPATMRVIPAYGSVTSVGPSGFLHVAVDPSGAGGLEWTGLDGSSRKLAGTQSVDPVEYYGTASDVVALPPARGTSDVQLRDMATDETITLTVPSGQSYNRTIGTTVVTRGGVRADGEWTELHLLDDDNGTTVDRPVTGLPEGSSILFVLRAGLHGFLTMLRVPGQDTTQYAWIDLDAAHATPLPYGTVYGNSTVTARHLVTPQPGGVRIYEQGRFDAPVREVEVSLKDSKVLGVVGDSLIVARYDPAFGTKTYQAAQYRVVAVPFDGSGERTLLARAVADRIAVRPDGGVQLVGGQSAEDYGYQAITAGADGVPNATRVLRVPPVPMQIQRLTVDHGIVRTLEYGDGITHAYDRRLVEAQPGYGERRRIGSLPVPLNRCSSGNGSCPELYPTGDGRSVYRGMVSRDGTWEPTLFVVGRGEAFPGTPRETGLQDSFDESDHQVRIIGASGNLVLVEGTPVGGGRELRVIDIDSGKVVHKESYRAGALWGTTLWTSTPNGTVTARDTRTGATLTTVTVGTGCVSIVDLQAVGKWLYWRCQTSSAPSAAGVYDLQARKSLALPAVNATTYLAGQAYLGDGRIAVRGQQGLDVYGLQTGTPVRQATVGAGLVAMDARNGDIAYTAPGQTVHVLHTGRPAAALVSPYRSVGARVETDSTPLTWKGEWWLSEPAASWTVEVRHRATGRLVATRSGGPAEYSVATQWDGRDAAGGLLPNGAYTWTLTAQPADGQGAPLVQSGTVGLTGGTTVWRDHIGGSTLPDGIGDLLTVRSSGTLTFHRGDGAGKFSSTMSTGGWPASVRALPYGDLNGDRCADVLVRPGDGTLRLYKPACGSVPKPTTPYTSLGSGWNQYDVMTSPGDVTQDGRPDLIARNSSTGTVYLYKGTSTGRLSARVKLWDNWKVYKKIVGVGDINGDGIGDLLAQDTSNNLYRYSGRGNGAFTPRVKLSANWGGSYNTVVGVGDITGDGKADLVARHATGTLHRLTGSGRGTFSGPVKIGTGWQIYKTLS
ncbi:FG-GAP-like repeat-containing protein [Streptomyces sp. NPDC052023]|uniref:FG-GAP-like repeat-containing protein n=1 Tax=Streptomyces sp. NPDC052023 TaxID=3365681 RepID=UPI0037D5B096